LPFQGTSTATVVASLIRDTPEAPLQVNPTLPTELGRIIGKALEKDREVRYQSAADLRGDLKRLRRDTDSGRSSVGTTASLQSAPPGRQLLLSVVGTVLAIAVIAAVYEWRRGAQRSGPNLQNMTIARLTDSGDVSHAAISPEGRYVAYVLQGVQPSLWVRQVATESAVQVLPPSEGKYWGIAFSRDGDYIYFLREGKGNKNFGDLYEIPVLGGSPKLVLKHVEMGFAVAPDGKRIAFIRFSPDGTVNTANIDGTGVRLLARDTDISESFSFASPISWTADGKMFALTSWWRKDGYTSAIRCYPAEGGKPSILPSRKLLIQAAWLHDQSGFLVAAAPAFTKNFRSQIWQQPFPEGEPQRITNDLGDYNDLSLTADDKLLSAVEKEVTSTVFVAPSSDPDHGVPITTAKSDGLAVLWMPNGSLILQDAKSQFSLAQADGKNRVSTFKDELGHEGISVCGDGRFVVFASAREGSRSSIWRVDSDGHNMKRLAGREGEDDADPHCSPDGAWVIYASLRRNEQFLRKVSIEGGPAVNLLNTLAVAPRYSPDGKQIAFYGQYDQQDRWIIFLISSAGGPRLKTFELPLEGSLNYWDYSMLHWTPDGQALTYPLLVGDEMNLWSQPISGGPPRQLTHFHDRILTYDWSPDGKRLAITRAKYSSDVVLISNFH
jgi:eukaryotic-like serine/threonine-protein kinase